MLQLAILRNDPEWVKERLALRNFRDTGLVDELLALDDERKKLVFQFDDTKARINSASRDIGQLMGKGQKDEAESRKKEVEQLKNQLEPIQKKLESVEKQVQSMLVQLPNLPSSKVPAGKTPEDNEVVRTGGSKPEDLKSAKILRRGVKSLGFNV